MALKTETDGFRVHGREIYWWRRKKHIAVFDRAAREGAPRALHDPQQQHDQKAGCEVAVESLCNWRVTGNNLP